jgi:hypothetical protein
VVEVELDEVVEPGTRVLVVVDGEGTLVLVVDVVATGSSSTPWKFSPVTTSRPDGT